MAGTPTWSDRHSRTRSREHHLGLPPRLLSSSLLGWEGLAEVVEALHLSPGERLLDLRPAVRAATGSGGGPNRVSNGGSRFFAEAVRQASENAQWQGHIAEFCVGDLAATGLDVGSVDAVLCVDAIQFADEPEIAYPRTAPGGGVGRTSGADVLGTTRSRGPPGAGPHTARRPRQGTDRCRLR